MRFISLDVSTGTGWAYFEVKDSGLVLLERGNLEHLPEPKDLNLPYPESYIKWSYDVFQAIKQDILIPRYFNAIVIEETAKGSRNAHSQKILEWTHYRLAQFIAELRSMNTLPYGVFYLQTGEWRTTAGCKMTKEESKRNQKITKVRKAAEAEGKKIVLVEVEPGKKKVGKINKKHVAIRRVKEIFDIDLMMKENDTADALLIGFSAYKRYFENNKKESI